MKTLGLYDYIYFRGSRNFQKQSERIKELANIVCSYSPNHVLDVGCGIGYLVKELNLRGVPTKGVDSAQALKDRFWGILEPMFLADATSLPFKNGEFDLVTSSDFLEHVPEENLDKVLSEMRRVCSGTILSRVAYEAKLTSRQSLYHVTNKSKEWWEEKVKPYGVILI